MGMTASYYAVSNETLNKYQAENHRPNDSVDMLFDELGKIDDEQSADLDKAWDGLHFLITGYDSDDSDNHQKSERNLLIYQAFFGKDVLNECLEVAVGYIDNNTVKRAALELEKTDIDALLDDVDFKKFSEKELYPDIWDEADSEFLKDYLKENFAELLEFYQKIAKNNQSAIIIIS